MSETLLQVENLRTYFHTFRGVVKAVDGISFSLDEGQVLGIVGESGSGKSVSSFSILKLIEPPGVVESDGILFQGEDISKKSEREMMKIRGKAISMVFQDPMTSLNPLYTIEKHRDAGPPPEADDQTGKARALCGIAAYGRYPQS